MVLFLEKESKNLIIQLGFNFKEKRGYQAVISNDVTDIADFWNEGILMKIVEEMSKSNYYPDDFYNK
jgi:hypothetical protein